MLLICEKILLKFVNKESFFCQQENFGLMLLLTIIPALVSAAIYVPHMQKESMLIYDLNYTGLQNMLQHVMRAVVFVHNEDSEVSITALNRLIETVPVFAGGIVFAKVNSKNASQLINEYSMDPPHLLCYLNGTLWNSYPFPRSETGLLNLIHLFAFGPMRPVHDIDELHKSLGTTHFALVYPSTETEKAVHLHRSVSASIGFLDLVPFYEPSANDLGLDPNTFYLFRIEDFYLKPIKKNPTALINATEPLFHRIIPSDLNNQDNLVFAIVLNQLTTFTSDILDSVATSHPEFVVGFIDSTLHDFANMSTSNTVQKLPWIILLNTSSREYYPIPTELNMNLAQKNISDILDVLKELPKPMFPSEKEPLKQDQSFTVLVGKTHDDFIQSKEHDSIVLYVSRDSLETRRAKRIFIEAAEEFNKYSTIKFGIINATSNAATYPTIPTMPHIHIYPAANKTNDRTYFGQSTRNDLIRFIKKYSSNQYDINVPDATDKELALELVQIYIGFASFDEADKIKANERLFEISLATGISIDEINDNIEKQIKSDEL